MKRVVVFAHYDKNNKIDDYVAYYLKSLKEAGCEVVFVSCCELDNSEIEKVKDYVIHSICEKHDEYNFGSYKRGFLYLKNFLNVYDELIFANDSCYGPIYPISEVFANMEKEDCDFWGITKNNFGYKKSIGHFFVKRPHIQSYFVAFNKKIFTSEDFQKFMLSVVHQDNKKLIVSKYEIGLTELLVKKCYKYKVLVNAFENVNNIAILKWRQIIENHKMPFIKKSLFDLKNTDVTTIENYENYLKNYPKNLIKLSRQINHKIPAKMKISIFDFISDFPFAIRKIFSILIDKIFIFVKD